MQSFGITNVPGIRVGHYTDSESATGCTVVLCESGAVGGVDIRGSAPGTRETALLHPTNLVSKVHAVLLGGGSTFGLDAASGVVRYLEEKGIGTEFGGVNIPIVPAAILFDLGVVTDKVRPGPQEGYMACQIAAAGRVAEGSVGAGTGATVGKLLGLGRAVQGGMGTASADLGRGLVVGALVAVNSIGGVYDPFTGEVVAGPRKDDGATMCDSLELITTPEFRYPETSSSNTTIGVVATNAHLSKEQANKLASVAHDGLAMAIRPAHMMRDGDVMFAVATGDQGQSASLDRVCAAATLCVSKAIIRAVRKAASLGGIPSVEEVSRNGP